MITIDPSEISERDNYKLLIGSIIPRPIAFVTSKSDLGTLNGAPFSYFNIVSSNPPLISLSIQRKDGKMKDTARNIIEGKEFVVHIVDESNVDKINKTAASLPPNESEVELAGLTPVESSKVDVPGIKEAKIRLECKLEHSVELGDTDLSGCDLLIGKVLQFHVDEELYSNGRIDQEKLGAVSRLAGNYYAKIGDVFEIERPK
ncbi:flavin reductase family protein [Bacillus sinesaloumensis]|uniref:flavin reductase family protein n=1 Tax=Litchfieldia sinesaloumensis TaxID=1926280 RepID=UPI00098893DB|nr:flavin reductase family protein [Bacillus sinesaloumensis]